MGVTIDQAGKDRDVIEVKYGRFARRYIAATDIDNDPFFNMDPAVFDRFR